MALLDIFKFGRPLVMLVDDDPDLLEMLSTFLGALNCKTVEISDGNNALETAKKHKPQLILLDIAMPKANGLEILQKLKQDSSTKNIPVVMVTAEQRVQELETAFKLGAADYMIKPVEHEQFEQKIKTLLFS
jgi:CheY-like chemotaxis protein